ASGGGRRWGVHTPVVPRGGPAGIFSIAFRDAQHGVVVGGDYRKESEAVDNAAVTADGGETWTRVPGLSGFRSVAAWVPRADRSTIGARSLIAIGPSGADGSSDDGLTWTPLASESFDAVSFAPGGRTGWATGQGGRISRLTLPR